MNQNLAKTLTQIAAAAAGVPSYSESLSNFSDRQNGAAADLSSHQLLGILRNRLTVEIEKVYDLALAGDPVASKEYEKKMMALADIAKAWAALNPSHTF